MIAELNLTVIQKARLARLSGYIVKTYGVKGQTAVSTLTDPCGNEMKTLTLPLSFSRLDIWSSMQDQLPKFKPRSLSMMWLVEGCYAEDAQKFLKLISEEVDKSKPFSGFTRPSGVMGDFYLVSHIWPAKIVKIAIDHFLPDVSRM